MQAMQASSSNNKTIELHPLVAETVQGSQERYQAVREMGWLLNTDSDNEHDNLLTYKNRLGYKEYLLGNPPPFNKHGFNLDAIFDVVDQSKVLKGPQLSDISVMLDALENIQLWNHALQNVNHASPSSFSATDASEQEQIRMLLFTELPKLAGAIIVNATLQD